MQCTSPTNTVATMASPSLQACPDAKASVGRPEGLPSRVHVPGQGVEKATESEGNPFLHRVPISGP